MVFEPIRIGNVAIDPVIAFFVLAGLAGFALVLLAVALFVHMSRRRR